MACDSPVPTFLVVGSHGSLEVATSTGEIVQFNGYEDYEFLRFDVQELATWLGTTPSALEGEVVDILMVGYWTPCGYEPPIEEARKVV